MKRVFGLFEVVFDIVYLFLALLLGLAMLKMGKGEISIYAGVMALVLVFGDSFHLLPRIIVVLKDQEEKYRLALGRGKQITSISMTIFYIFLWEIGLGVSKLEIDPVWSYTLYGLALLRIVLCFLPGNRWTDRHPPVKYGIIRNIPFLLEGLMVSGLYFSLGQDVEALRFMWLAILLSFLFYLPVVLWANKKPMIGMLMLPKTCTYIWILFMCLFYIKTV